MNGRTSSRGAFAAWHENNVANPKKHQTAMIVVCLVDIINYVFKQLKVIGNIIDGGVAAALGDALCFISW